MLVQLKKFGTTLVSRPSGKEALLAFRPTLSDLKKGEDLIIDFDGVLVLTPSWIDEFLTPLVNSLKKQVKLVNKNNPSVKVSLQILSQQHQIDLNSYEESWDN
ncbi:MAG: DUF4325 domain-containing protein [Candidatus Pacebacteria bacterium CG_4_10_14_0_8_um_filter_42_14]|nr:MAG: DUF4325 domain-containing protein [Candidatus Pacebacteria bacterium CG_4_10_14_0_8_um_filter_42_14]